MPDDRQRERDLILSPNEYAFISDQTKGNINVYVGPYKASLSTTDQPISFNSRSKRFEKCSLERSIEPFAIAPESWYLTMKNPAKDAESPNPQKGTVNNMAELKVGHKVNIPGPIAFPLWPGQMVKVVKGHHLRSNQYLVVRVYDEIAARENWGNAVMKSQGEGAEAAFDVEKLSLGQQLIIKGTDVSFYIPPTGIEVVKDTNGEYIRKAVTLERLEYCILLDENGNKRYVRGPEVVFPEPTESFIKQDGKRKYRAIELSEIKGIYIKVIAPYEEGEPGTDSYKQYKEGDELFLTGNDMMIYFPRREHATIKYGDNEIHHAVAIPTGEARYVMNRINGEVTLRRGPDMCLPDPRKEVIVRRVLSQKQVNLLFPGNAKAQEINDQLRRELSKKKSKERSRTAETPAAAAIDDSDDYFIVEEASEVFSGDSFQRKQTYTPPRTITLDTKYEGAVSIDVWTGYAIMIVSKSGERKVIVGPKTYLLEYDEEIQVFSLSCGNPKTDQKLIQDVYLRVLNNKVSDTLSLETKDFVPIQIKLSYRLNFIDDPNSWFNVENYVKFLTDRLRSILRAQVKNYTINEFYSEAFKLIRKIVLGEGEKLGYHFSENNMFIYDVEVVEVNIQDENIAAMLVEAQQSLIEESATKTRESAKLDITKFLEQVRQQTAEAEYDTRKMIFDYEKSELDKKTLLEIAKIEAKQQTNSLQLNNQLNEENLQTSIKKVILEREKKSNEQDIFFAGKNQDLYERKLEAQIKAVVEKAQAISPDLIAALQSFGDKELLQKVAESMAPLSILGGESVAEVFGKLLQGTKLEGVFLNIGSDTVNKILPKKKD
ncbi:MAG: SPFH domain-containing protein [Spirochaetota bacterium]